MSGYQTVLQIRRLEEDLAKVGLMMCYPKHGYGVDRGDYVAVKPRDAESLPIYARDAELFCGTLSGLRDWLTGVEWARSYDMMLRLSNEKRRAKKEQDLRNEHLIKLLKNEKISEVKT